MPLETNKTTTNTLLTLVSAISPLVILVVSLAGSYGMIKVDNAVANNNIKVLERKVEHNEKNIDCFIKTTQNSINQIRIDNNSVSSEISKLRDSQITMNKLVIKLDDTMEGIKVFLGRVDERLKRMEGQ